MGIHSALRGFTMRKLILTRTPWSAVSEYSDESTGLSHDYLCIIELVVNL
jgi:hypothetical protein